MIAEKNIQRDYSLVGRETRRAIETGLAEAEWYKSPVPRDKMRELLVRKNGPAIRDTLIWFGLISGSGYLVYLLWGSWFALFPYIMYSVLYASTSDSRWHETSHGTAFKSNWMNDTLYEIASFMVLRQSTVWRWSHTRHHSDTIIRGRDPEIAVPRPPDLKKIALGFVGLSGAIPELRRLFLHARGRIDPEVATYLPEYEYAKVILKARIYLLIFLIVIILAVWFRSILPLMFIGLPTILGGWLMPIYGLTQHAGLQENVLDHRLNCRTVYMNRIHRFLYWNMNYHVEHHMFPLVPYHALPRLHVLMKDDCPVAYNGIIEAFKEIIPALLKQVKDPSYFVERKLPERRNINSQSDMARYFGDTRSLTDSRVTICRVDDIPLGDVIRFDFQQKTYAVYRTENNEFYATDGFCTHGNAHLAEGVLFGDIIECAKHNGRFNVKDGSPERAPVIVGLNTYKVEVSEDKVVMILSVIEGEQPGTSEDERIFRVISNRNITAFIKELVLSPADFANFSFIPGQYVKITVPPGRIYFSDFKIDEPHYKTWVELGLFDMETENMLYSKRDYSMANNPATEPDLRFNVRLALPPAGSFVPPGAGSSYMFNLKPDDKVRLTGPYGDFLLKKSDREMIFLGGGAGMAPLRSHLAYLFETEKTKRKVSYWYGARSFSDLFYTEYFEKLEKENPNFSFHTALSEPKTEDKWNGQLGFIHDYLHAYYLSSHPHPEVAEYYVCGPPAMIKASLNMLGSLGVPDEMIAFDEF